MMRTCQERFGAGTSDPLAAYVLCAHEPMLGPATCPEGKCCHMLYFFNIAGAVYDPDVEGYELPSMHEARLMAAKHAGEVLRDRPGLA